MENKNNVGLGLGSLIGIGVTLVVAAIVLIFGIDVLADIRDDFTSGTSERNASEDAITGIAKLPEKYPILVSVIVAALIIGILMTAFAVRGMS